MLLETYRPSSPDPLSEMAPIKRPLPAGTHWALTVPMQCVLEDSRKYNEALFAGPGTVQPSLGIPDHWWCTATSVEVEVSLMQ